MNIYTDLWVRDRGETFDFESETRPRPLISRLRPRSRPKHSRPKLFSRP